MSPDSAVLHALMTEAATLARGRRPASRQQKAAQDYVTDLDLDLDAFLQARLACLTPGCAVLSEERSVAPGTPAGSGYWIVDPLDGTANAIAGLPFTAISAAFIDADGLAVAAVVSIADGTTWLARRGGGAWLARDSHRQPLQLHAEAPPGELLVVSTGLLDRLVTSPAGRQAWPALRRLGKIRNLGAQALHLCGIASGRFAAVLSLEARIWDEAAAGLILREAGGHWQSAADAADWTDPAAVMALPPRLSLGAHPAITSPLREALAPLLGAGDGPGNGVGMPSGQCTSAQ